MSLEIGLQVRGVEINYYFVCKKKLWFFTHEMNMEYNSTLVEMGKEVHTSSYLRDRKEIMIDNLICLDFVEKELVVNETKLSKSMEEATRFQLMYYLYYLESKGVEGLRGVIRYPRAKKSEEIILTQKDKEVIDEVIKDIYRIKDMSSPPSAAKERKCNKCSYYEFCFC